MAAQKSMYQQDAENKRAAQGGTSSIAATKGDEQGERDKEKHTGFTAAKAGAGAGGGSDMPKQGAGESAGAYGARLREWRQKKQAAIR